MRPLVHEPTKTVSTAIVAQRGAGGQAHVLQRALGGGARVRVGEAAGSGTVAPSGSALAGLVPQVTNGVSVGGVDRRPRVEDGVVVGAQRPPVLDGGVPVRALRARAGGP